VQEKIMSSRESKSPPDHGSHSTAPHATNDESSEGPLGDAAGSRPGEIPQPPQSHVRATYAFELDGVDIVAVTNDLQRWLG
jgi:hypothetical protein